MYLQFTFMKACLITRLTSRRSHFLWTTSRSCDNCRRWRNLCVCVYEMSGLQSDTDRGEPQGWVLRCQLTNGFDIISSKQHGKKWCLLLRQEGKSSNSIAHSLYHSHILPVFHSHKYFTHLFIPLSTIQHLYISLGRRSYSVMRALHTDSHTVNLPVPVVGSSLNLGEHCWWNIYHQAARKCSLYSSLHSFPPEEAWRWLKRHFSLAIMHAWKSICLPCS